MNIINFAIITVIPPQNGNCSLSPILANVDVITRCFDGLFIWGGNLSSATYFFPIKATLMLLVPLVLCHLFMKHRAPTLFSQITICVIGILIVSAIPVNRLVINNAVIKTWVWLISNVMLIFLPSLLASVLVPTIGAQKILTRIIYGILGFLFLINLFMEN